MKTTFRTRVFKRAHEIAHVTGKEWSVCLFKAWMLDRLGTQMKKGVVNFAYERLDGSLRKARGTLKGTENLIKGNRQENYKVFCYYDIDVKGFRSFRIEKFLTIY